jgi:hypothetical protein
MKIRFLTEFPEVRDDLGAFQVHPVNFGAGGLTLAEMVATGFRVPSPPPRMVITAVSRDGVRGLVGTRLSSEEFASASAATQAMNEGVEVFAITEVEALAQRLIAAKVAELVG